MAHFWPEFRSWLRDIRDTRDQDQIVYSRGFLTCTAILLFILRLKARRQINFALDTRPCRANLNALSGSRQDTVPHSDTVEHFLGHVPTRSLEILRRQMVMRLLRMKALEDGRLQGYFLVAVDGTGQLHFAQRHCPHCLERTHDGVAHYYHQVLEAKLITPEGLAISIGSEFMENADPKAPKQDCEMKAFVRLAEKLKKDYPQLQLCLCMDALYANGTVLEICRKNNWKYFITFKEGSLPALWQEYQALRNLCPDNRRNVRLPNGAQQRLGWVEHLEHVDDRKRIHRVNAFDCYEQWNGKTFHGTWLTNFPIRRDNVMDLANRGARCRWKIENEGFNIQKNGGFNLEHAYSTKNQQIHNWYLLLQIAHLIGQMLERGSLLSREFKKSLGSLFNLTQRLAESLRYILIPEEALDMAAAARMRIRLNSS